MLATAPDPLSDLGPVTWPLRPDFWVCKMGMAQETHLLLVRKTKEVRRCGFLV